MLDTSLKEQLQSIFSTLQSEYTLAITGSPQHESYAEMAELLNDLASCSDKISCTYIEAANTLEFVLLKDKQNTGIRFRGVPNGHEFTSLLLALLNCDKKGKNLPDADTTKRIQALKGPIKLSTYVSLTCTNCPDVVQALNIVASLHPNIEHEMVDGAINEAEIEQLNIQGVPSVYADGKLIHVGRGDLGELLEKLENEYGSNKTNAPAQTYTYDVVVVGGGPAGSSAAIYSARKGLRVAVLAERIGGQVKETLGIENLISTPKTTGSELAAKLKQHMQDYPIDIFEHRKVLTVNTTDKGIHEVEVSTGDKFIAPALILATGAGWRKLNIPGEAEYIGRGVAFCPHCDGPFYKGKKVAVIGGGNSGIEAAIDLAGICEHVTVVEFMHELKADQLLQQKLQSLPNVEVLLSAQALEMVGNQEKIVALRIKDRNSQEEKTIALDGIFVQIGLSPNSSAFTHLVDCNATGEIVVDSHCRTQQKGIYAAGDVTTVPYKQIIVAMGEGAKAALTAFDDKIRGLI